MDFSDGFGATIREVSDGERAGQSTHIVRARRTYPTSNVDLWNALTQPNRICLWFAEVSGDLKPGGRFAVKGNAEGEVVSCEPPRSFGLTWEFGESISWVSVSIEASQAGARLNLEHELPTDQKSETHWMKYGPGATGVGWEMGFLGLDAYLSGNGESLLDAGAAWAESTQGKATLRSWSKAWGAAHIVAGAPEQKAKDMADRTARFYTETGKTPPDSA